MPSKQSHGTKAIRRILWDQAQQAQQALYCDCDCKCEEGISFSFMVEEKGGPRCGE